MFKKINPINVSFSVIDLILSADLFDWESPTYQVGLRGLGHGIVNKVLSDLPGGLLIKHRVHQSYPSCTSPGLGLGRADLNIQIERDAVN